VKQITATAHLPIPQEKAWSLITKVKDYPKIMPFTYSVTATHDPLKKGSSWSDITTILWIPLRMTHHIYRYDAHHSLGQRIDLPFRAELDEQFRLKTHGESTEVFVTVTFHPGEIPLSPMILSIWEKRMKYLVQTAVQNLEHSCRSNR
jgi:ribosome-associated toxin RatA of RatAB toxin-antitoxin module